MAEIMRTCGNCHGDGSVECPCCQTYCYCSECDGTGFVPIEQERVVGVVALESNADQLVVRTHVIHSSAAPVSASIVVIKPLEFILSPVLLWR